MTSTKYYEKFWDCPACGRVHISALRNARCPACGGPKVDQENERFSMEEITDDFGIALSRSGVNWDCTFCGSVNLDMDNSCRGCGNPKGSDNQARVAREVFLDEIQKDIAASSVIQSQEMFDSGKTDIQPAAAPVAAYTQPIKKTKIGLIFAGIGIGFLILLFFLMRTKSVSVEIDALKWQRVIHIEMYQTVQESGWSKPTSSYNVKKSKKLHHTNKIYETRTRSGYRTETETKYRDNGNGAMEAYTVTREVPYTETYQELVREDPVYQTWYVYDIDVWRAKRQVLSEGTSQTDVHWPEMNLENEGKTVIGAERKGKTEEVYKVIFAWNQKGKVHTTEKALPYEEWRQLNPKAQYRIRVNLFDEIVGEIEPIE